MTKLCVDHILTIRRCSKQPKIWGAPKEYVALCVERRQRRRPSTMVRSSACRAPSKLSTSKQVPFGEPWSDSEQKARKGFPAISALSFLCACAQVRTRRLDATNTSLQDATFRVPAMDCVPTQRGRSGAVHLHACAKKRIYTQSLPHRVRKFTTTFATSLSLYRYAWKYL